MLYLTKIKSFLRKIYYFKYYKEQQKLVAQIRKTGSVEPSGRFIYEPTVRCNLNCQMCYIPPAVKHSPADELDFSQIKTLFKPILSKMETVNIIGGEPFCHQDILEIIKFFTQHDIKISSLATNATLINSAKIKELAKINNLESIGVSIDSAIPKLHDTIRGVPGSFNRSATAIKELIKIGKKVDMIGVILKNNLYKLNELVDLAKELNVSKIFFEYERFYTQDEINQTKELLNLKSHELNMPADDRIERGYKFKELKQAITNLRKYAQKVNMPIGFFPGYFLEKIKDCYKREIRKNNHVFCSAFFRPRIDEKGNLFFCYLIKKKFADLKQNNFEEIWNNQSIKDFRKKLLNNNMSPVCEGCFYLRILGR